MRDKSTMLFLKRIIAISLVLFAMRSLVAANAPLDFLSAQNNNPFESLLSKTPKENILLFVSFSLPKASLSAYMQQGKAYGIPLLLQGLLGNSLQATSAAIRNLGKSPYGMQINPQAFLDYHIHAVPALLVFNPDNPQDYDVVYGNAPLADLLEEVVKKGRVGSETAKAALAEVSQ